MLPPDLITGAIYAAWLCGALWLALTLILFVQNRIRRAPFGDYLAHIFGPVFIAIIPLFIGLSVWFLAIFETGFAFIFFCVAIEIALGFFWNKQTAVKRSWTLDILYVLVLAGLPALAAYLNVKNAAEASGGEMVLWVMGVVFLILLVLSWWSGKAVYIYVDKHLIPMWDRWHGPGSSTWDQLAEQHAEQCTALLTQLRGVVGPQGSDWRQAEALQTQIAFQRDRCYEWAQKSSSRRAALALAAAESALAEIQSLPKPWTQLAEEQAALARKLLDDLHGTTDWNFGETLLGQIESAVGSCREFAQKTDSISAFNARLQAEASLQAARRRVNQLNDPPDTELAAARRQARKGLEEMAEEADALQQQAWEFTRRQSEFDLTDPKAAQHFLRDVANTVDQLTHLAETARAQAQQAHIPSALQLARTVEQHLGSAQAALRNAQEDVRVLGSGIPVVVTPPVADPLVTTVAVEPLAADIMAEVSVAAPIAMPEPLTMAATVHLSPEQTNWLALMQEQAELAAQRLATLKATPEWLAAEPLLFEVDQLITLAVEYGKRAGAAAEPLAMRLRGYLLEAKKFATTLDDPPLGGTPEHRRRAREIAQEKAKAAQELEAAAWQHVNRQNQFDLADVQTAQKYMRTTENFVDQVRQLAAGCVEQARHAQLPSAFHYDLIAQQCLRSVEAALENARQDVLSAQGGTHAGTAGEAAAQVLGEEPAGAV